MKKLLACIIIFVTMISNSLVPVQAKESNEVSLNSLLKTPINNISDSTFSNMKAEINNMSDKEFDDYVTAFVSKETNKNIAKEKLSKVGVSLDFQEADQLYSIQSISPSYLTLTTYSAHRGNDSYHRLYCSFDWNGYGDDKPATYDVLGLFFNKNMASYYGSNQSNENLCWLKDSSQFMNGTILFNVDDNKLSIWTTGGYVAVYVTPTTTGTFVYGGKYVHTYNTTNTTTSGSATVNFSGTGVTGSIGFSVTSSTVEANWEKGSDNAVMW